MAGGFDLSDYISVAERRAKLRADHPDAVLQTIAVEWKEIGGKTLVIVCAACWYGPDDPLPGIATASEEFPGSTPYTRGSELMNAETSAYGRAIWAKGATDTSKSVASRDEVESRRAADPESGPVGGRPASDAQIRALEREIETRGLPDGVPWPIPKNPPPSMRDASHYLDLVTAQPRETPRPSHVRTFRQDLDDAPPPASSSAPAPNPATGRSDAGGTAPGDGGGPGEVTPSRPWERRAFPFDADPHAIGRLWKTWIAAVPGIGPAKLLTTARAIAEESGIAVPSSIDEISDPELVNAVRLWLTNRADERGADAVAHA